jgi:hypothetical protein
MSVVEGAVQRRRENWTAWVRGCGGGDGAVGGDEEIIPPFQLDLLSFLAKLAGFRTAWYIGMVSDFGCCGSANHRGALNHYVCSFPSLLCAGLLFRSVALCAVCFQSLSLYQVQNVYVTTVIHMNG